MVIEKLGVYFLVRILRIILYINGNMKTIKIIFWFPIQNDFLKRNWTKLYNQIYQAKPNRNDNKKN